MIPAAQRLPATLLLLTTRIRQARLRRAPARIQGLTQRPPSSRLRAPAPPCTGALITSLEPPDESAKNDSTGDTQTSPPPQSWPPCPTSSSARTATSSSSASHTPSPIAAGARWARAAGICWIGASLGLPCSGRWRGCCCGRRGNEVAAGGRRGGDGQVLQTVLLELI
ncbi:hypothetical protein BD626DRAFT_33057 [Schizophyllum amplum]|uniref:Uncharacterized protein n=1 Tax=Schizophyllum amplum TaxID=97359 RepID=A0A550CE85_9AGAR|nr:hypothetical protein BD626DRAFT_33057 [Auriculariopsis ampla]